MDSNLPPQIKISDTLYKYAKWLEDNPTTRRTDGLLHVSDLTGGPGWNCDRYIEYVRMANPNINEKSTAPAFIRPTFWVGKGIELMTDDVLEDALKTMLPLQGYEFISLETQVAAVDKELGIIAHADYVLTYSKDGKEARQIIDSKSTSKTQDDRRSSALNATKSEPDLEHVRQVALYKHMYDAAYGSLLYITKTFPHRLSDGNVAGDRVWPTIARRIKRIDKDLAEGTRAMPTRGPHCEKCQWSEECRNDPGLK